MTLAEKLERGPLEPDEGLRCVIEIAVRLEGLHREGQVHGRVNPGNIRVGEGHAVLADPGASRSQHAPFTAPEQARGDAVDPRTDLYALGRVLQVLLKAGPRQARPVPAALQRVIERCLKEDPEERWSGAAELRRELIAWRGPRGLPWPI